MLSFIAGLTMVCLLFYDVFHSIMVPRVSPVKWRMAPLLGRQLFFPIFLAITDSRPLKKRRDDLLGFYAPVFFAFLILIWLFLLVLGYALIFYGLKGEFRPPLHDFGEAFYFAGTSVLTLGFGDIVAYGLPTRFIVLTAAVAGLSFMALSISYLFTVQALVQQREQVVNTAISRAGTPASGVVILLRYKELGIMHTLGSSFVAWESWVASILESHRAYPILLFFRSTNQTESWISVLGAMLDAASLLLTTTKEINIGESELFYWLGCSTVQALCKAFNLDTVDGVHLKREQFSQALELLRSAGFELKDEGLAWKLFQIRRKAYMGYLRALSQEFATPTHAWIYELATQKGAAERYQTRV